MDNLHGKRMTLQEIIGNKELFLKNYDLIDEFEKSGYDWDELMEIAKKFDEDRTKKYPKLAQKYISKIASFDSIHSYRYRIKETDSFIKKIIIKANEKGKRVTWDDYLVSITDLIGIRVLYVFKEDYYTVHKQLMQEFKHQLVENVHIKLQKGDDISIYEKILDCDPVPEYNNTYRSIHYTLCAEEKNIKGVRLEIQTRTIFEEGWSEINHKLVYKNQAISDYFVLTQASKILSTLVGNCDTLGMLMKNIYDEYMKRKANITDSSQNDAIASEIMEEVLNEFLLK